MNKVKFSPHISKFTTLYEKYGLGAVKNIWLLVCLSSISKTVNLYKQKDYVGALLCNKETSCSSHYKRLLRFFQDWGSSLDLLNDLRRLNLQFLKSVGGNVLVMDGTSWQSGSQKIHYLVLSVVIKDVAIPIYWKQLEKLGSSNQEERKALFIEAMKIFDIRGMTLLADREYIGRGWFNFLKGNHLDFVIRLRWGDYFEEVNQEPGLDYDDMYKRCLKKNKTVKKKITLGDSSFYLIMVPNLKPNAKEDVMILLTTLSKVNKAGGMYLTRWKIETMFKHLKTNGYNLEELNLEGAGKHELMMAIVAIAYTLSIREGLKHSKDIPKQKYRDGLCTLEISVFRKGLEFLIQKCMKFIRFLKYVLKALSHSSNHPILQNVQ
jgi:hypothetical protein